jgi:hypothetical protein
MGGETQSRRPTEVATFIAMRIVTARSFGLIALITFAMLGVPVRADQPSAHIQGAEIRTVAGNGNAGSRDGDALRATFFLPVAVAYDKVARRVLIADSAGQSIRMLNANGTITTIAGSGAPQASGLSVAGGYADGIASKARFNNPSGLAAAPSGTIYVADSFNHCVRRISEGRVVTFAGKPLVVGSQDGPLATATFTEPRSIALSSSGDIYVLDHWVGVRVIRRGHVETLPIPQGLAGLARAITVLDAPDPILFLALPNGVARYVVRSQHLDVIDATPQQRAGLSPSGIVALGIDSVVVSSMHWAGLFFVHFPNQYTHVAFSRQIAGERIDDGTETGGFHDGVAEEAAFTSPAGLALDGHGNIIIADSGNRRIRTMSAIDDRWADGTFSAVKGPRTYRVLLAGGPAVFWNSMYPDSIAAGLETGMNSLLTQRRDPHRWQVGTFRTDDASIPVQAAQLITLLPRIHADLLIWSMSAHDLDAAGMEVGAALTSVATCAQKERTRVIVVTHPLGAQIWPSGSPIGGDDLDDPPARGAESTLSASAKPFGIPVYSLRKDFVDEEIAPHPSIFDVADAYFSRYGNAFYAKTLLRHLATYGPAAQ